MKSNVCKIEKGTKDLVAILKESENVALYNGFDKKQTLQLRLICEEMDGMLPNIISDFDGEFWIECENGVCKVNVSIDIPDLNINEKEALINVAKNKKNAAAVGIVGKIRNVIENLFLDKDNIPTYDMSALFNLGMESIASIDSSYMWSLRKYKTGIAQEKETEEWDELEKSIIANLADDVIVGVKGKKANIIVVKKFKWG